MGAQIPRQAHCGDGGNFISTNGGRARAKLFYEQMPKGIDAEHCLCGLPMNKEWKTMTHCTRPIGHRSRRCFPSFIEECNIACSPVVHSRAKAPYTKCTFIISKKQKEERVGDQRLAIRVARNKFRKRAHNHANPNPDPKAESITPTMGTTTSTLGTTKRA
ncbi:hypothetical protein Scep_013382 [Stephania cephalantha]|uniref:Uncharacterized protein n=1 Tax=Stephania cephalantha TaxID=152367 RepID=A0AAP0P8E5_9MAGN